MKKTLTLLVSFVMAFIYYGSNNPEWTEAYTTYRTNSGYLPVAHRGLGDLYNMSFLSAYNGPLQYHLRKATPEAHGIGVYLFCDSYLISHVEKENFYGADTLIKIKWWDQNSYRSIASLDTTLKNILIIELAERFVRDACGDFNLMTAPLTFKPDGNDQNDKSTEGTTQKEKRDFIEKHFFNPNINSNLELNLFSYKIFNKVKEMKGDLNFHLFNRVSNEVYVDTEKQFLYFKPTLSGDIRSNSFFPIDSNELKNIVTTLGHVKTHYLQSGFDEVYFTFIPNPVSVIHPDLGKYNQLMPSLYAVDTAFFKSIDVYSIFKKDPKRYYANNDTHWNSTGLQTWLDETNLKLKSFLPPKNYKQKVGP